MRKKIRSAVASPLYQNDLDRHLFTVGGISLLGILAGLMGWLFFRRKKPKKGWWW